MTPAKPFYRLHQRGDRFEVDRVVGEILIDGYDPSDDWGWMVDAPEIADVDSRDAALAVLRLCGATEFQDWTDVGHRRGWESPLTPLGAS